MRTRWRLSIAVADVVVLVTAIGFVSLRTARPLSIDDAVRRFRATQTDADVTVGPTQASDSTDQAGGRRESAARKASLNVSLPRRARSPGASALPREGVYAYATSGWEQVSIPGGRHDYPESTTITLRHGGCGTITRWDALVERWDERETCPSPAGEQLRSLTSYHEFFRHGERLTYRCSPGSLARPAIASKGERWGGSCTSDGSTATFQGVVIGRERLSV